MTRTTPIAALLATALAGCSQEAADEVAVVSGDDETTTPAGALPRTASTAGATVFFISPADGDTVSNPVLVEFGVTGMDIVKAGQNQPGSGHHHLIIDAALPGLNLPVPTNEHYLHFGDASVSTELTLDPGSHTLQLLLGDHIHVPHDPPVLSNTITVIVE